MANIENTNSPSYSRYSYGYVNLKHKGVITTTSVGSEYDDFLLSMNLINGRPGVVPPFCSNRPDLIADIFYDSPGYWWYPMQYNNITDPFESLNRGDDIFIPPL